MLPLPHVLVMSRMAMPAMTSTNVSTTPEPIVESALPVTYAAILLVATAANAQHPDTNGTELLASMPMNVLPVSARHLPSAKTRMALTVVHVKRDTQTRTATVTCATSTTGWSMMALLVAVFGTVPLLHMRLIRTKVTVNSMTQLFVQCK